MSGDCKDNGVCVFRVLIRSIRGARAIHFILMGILGVILSVQSRLLTDFGAVLRITFISAALFSAWQFTTMLNDAYDIEIDRKAHPDRPLVSGEVSPQTYRRMYLTFALLSIIFSFVTGLFPLLSAASFLALAYLYSVPPFRVRDRPYGTVIIGAASALSFLAGFSSLFWPPAFRLFFHIPYFTPQFITAFLIIFIALSVSPLITAYRDWKADAEAGVVSIYTVMGPDRGKLMVSLLVPPLFLLPVLLFHTLLDILVSLVAGITASAVFFRTGRPEPVFSLYLFTLIYFLLRFLAVF